MSTKFNINQSLTIVQGTNSSVKMTSLAGFIFVYVFGGLTFIPITIAIVFYLTSSPKKDVENEENDKLVVDVDSSFKAGDLN